MEKDVDVRKGMVIKMSRQIWLSAKKTFWQLARITKTEQIISFLYRFFLDFFVYKKRLIWFEVKSVREHCADGYGTLIEIEPEQDRVVYEPAYLGGTDNGKEHYFRSPSVYVAVMRNVMAVGSTGLVIDKGNVLCDAIKNDAEQHIDFMYGPIARVEADRVQVKVRKEVKEIGKAINLCGLASFNYYHFTMEVLSRFGYAERVPEAGKLPVLIDEEIKMHCQLEEFLHIVCSDREIIYVPNGTRIKADLLICPSMNTWMPINVNGEKKFRLSDNLMAKSGILNIRASAKRYMKAQTARMIYISRKNCHAIRVVNESEIIPVLEEEGFEVVCTESMSYAEQVALFSSARCVVAPTGASLTNVIYCHPGTVVGCMIPQEYNFCIYSTLAWHIGGEALFLNPEIVSRGGTIGEDCYQIRPEVCRRYVKKLIEMCREGM